MHQNFGTIFFSLLFARFVFIMNVARRSWPKY